MALKLTAMHPANWESDTRQSDRACFPPVTAELACFNAGAGRSTTWMCIHPLGQKQRSISSFCLCEAVRAGHRLTGKLDWKKINK